jgi:hypothetical protein
MTFPAGSRNLAVISGASTPIGCTSSPPVSDDRVDGRRDAVHHDVELETGFPGGRPADHPGAADLADGVVEGRAPVAATTRGLLVEGQSEPRGFLAAGQLKRSAHGTVARCPYQWSKKTGAIAASAAPTCRARMGAACLGDCGNHLMAKNNTIGTWAAMRSCQMWAAAPSSAWGAVPCQATKNDTVARAPKDIATGRKALGCFSMDGGFTSPTDRFGTTVKNFAPKSNPALDRFRHRAREAGESAATPCQVSSLLRIQTPHVIGPASSLVIGRPATLRASFI